MFIYIRIMAEHITTTDDIKEIINDFIIGDASYWKSKFNDVICELEQGFIDNECEYVCEWCAERPSYPVCSICYDMIGL